MTVVVSFITPAGIGGGASGVGRVMAQERLTPPATTTRAAGVGETVLVCNGEADVIAVAYGTTPDADAATENLPTTSAGFPVAAGQMAVPFAPGVGNKINVKAVI